MSGAPQPLGRHFGPCPATWSWSEGTNNGERVHVLAFETPTGTFGIVLDDDSLRRFAQQATMRTTGLAVQTNRLVVPGGQG